MDKSKPELNWEKAKNAASDLAITTFITFFPLARGTDILQIPYVGTSDSGLAGFLSEIGYSGVYVDEGIYPVGNGTVGYRDGSIARTEDISSIANRLSEKFSFDRKLSEDNKSLRLDNLFKISATILEKNFAITLGELRKTVDVRC